MIQLLVLHGPNLNLFGRREPHIYGTTTLAEIDARLQTLAKELGVGLETFQSNHEGSLVDKLHERIDSVAGALVNPAGLTQHGVPLHDAIKAMPFPVIEVHMSNIAAREQKVFPIEARCKTASERACLQANLTASGGVINAAQECVEILPPAPAESGGGIFGP